MGGYVGAPYTPGSKTSEQTARDNLDGIRNQRELIWRHIHALGEHGATFDETVVALDLGYTSSSRFTELRRLGRIRRTDRTRDTRQGNSAAVHVAVNPADWTDKSAGWPAPRRSKNRNSNGLDRKNLAIATRALERIIALENRVAVDMFTASNMAEAAKTALDTIQRSEPSV